MSYNILLYASPPQVCQKELKLIMVQDILEKFSRILLPATDQHTTGIPYNPQGQGIVECAHQTIKNTLHKLKRGGIVPTEGIPQVSPPSCLVCPQFSEFDAMASPPLITFGTLK